MPAPLNPPIRAWRGLRVWLVGASSGIGAALALELAGRGARLALSARRPAALADVARRCAGADGPPLQLPLDVTEAQDVQAAHDHLLDAWGGVDLVVWLAADYAPMRADAFDLATARRTMDTNLALFNGLAVLLPTLRRQGRGALAIVSSVAGYRGLPRALVYGPTKAALNNLADSLYLDLRPLGIGVHLVSPGFVDTPLTAGNDFSMPGLLAPAEAARALLEGLERGRFEIRFPRGFTLAMRLLGLLPHRLYFALVRRYTGCDRPSSPDAPSP